MKFNGRRADMHMRTFALVHTDVYTKGIHRHMQKGRHRHNHTHQINTVCFCSSVTLTQPLLESEMRIWQYSTTTP